MQFSGQKTQKFCSVKCGALYRAPSMTGARLDEPRQKPCEKCGVVFGLERCAGNIAKFRVRRFCSTKCSAVAVRPTGDKHPMWKPELLEKQRTSRGPQQAWARNVKKRDSFTCRTCGQHGGKLEAHHIHEFSKVEQLRWDVENGITLCFSCHKDLHASLRVEHMYGVNSVELCGNVRPVDNTEPSLRGNSLEGVTTNSRAYGTWEGSCSECGKLFQRQMAKVRNRVAVFCGCSCAAKARMRSRVYGSNADTSAPHRKVKI